MYSLEYSTQAKKFIKGLDKHILIRITGRLENLEKNPHPSDAKFIGRGQNNEKTFRYRIGDYRALYKVKEPEQVVLIAKIDKRPRVYK